MSSVRLQIVEAIAAALATATGLTVHRNLDYALKANKLPAIALMSGRDEPTGAVYVNYIEHIANITAFVLVAADGDPEAAADPVECGIHAALVAPATFGGHQLVSMARGQCDWNFDLGDCAARELSYSFGFITTLASLESAA